MSHAFVSIIHTSSRFSSVGFRWSTVGLGGYLKVSDVEESRTREDFFFFQDVGV